MVKRTKSSTERGEPAGWTAISAGLLPSSLYDKGAGRKPLEKKTHDSRLGFCQAAFKGLGSWGKRFSGLIKQTLKSLRRIPKHYVWWTADTAHHPAVKHGDGRLMLFWVLLSSVDMETGAMVRVCSLKKACSDPRLGWRFTFQHYTEPKQTAKRTLEWLWDKFPAAVEWAAKAQTKTPQNICGEKNSKHVWSLRVLVQNIDRSEYFLWIHSTFQVVT